jgi:predicted dienelactone hydrolase
VSDEASRFRKRRPASVLARVGTVGVLFFLLKGLLWLAIPVLLAVAR